MSEQKLDTRKSGSLVASEFYSQLRTEAGYTGHENVRTNSVSMPFLRIAQDLTKQAKKKNPEYIEGLEPKMFFNTTSQKVYGEKVKVIALDYFESFIEWKPNRGGFVKVWTPQEFEKEKANCDLSEGKYIRKNGNEVQDTRNYFVIFPDNLSEGIALFPLTGTGVTASRKWMSKIENTLLPKEFGGGKAEIYTSVWDLELGDQKNDKGQWYQINVPKQSGWVWENEETGRAVLEAVKVVKELRTKSTEIDYSKADDTKENTNTDDAEF